MKNLPSFFVIALLLVSCGATKTKSSYTKKAKIVNPSIYANTIIASELKTALYEYASDEFQGRNTGAEGQKMAVNFLKEHYIKYGVPAAMPSGNYFQDVPLEVLSTPEVKLTIAGKDYKYMDDMISLNAGGNEKFSANEIVYAGYGIDDNKYSDYLNIDVKNKVVLIKAGEPKNADGTYVISGSSKISKWSNFRQQFSDKRDLAKAKGAKALLFYYPEVYQMAVSRYGRSSGRMKIASKGEEMYYFMVNDGLAKSIVSDINENDKAMSVKIDMTMIYKMNTKKIATENVAAYIEGSEKPNEIIVISAHLDHEGVKDGEIYNGADDDGSGTVAVLEIAEAFAKAKKDGNGPRRSILFLNVTGEEKGLLGSQYYTDYAPIFPLANTMVDLNIDMIGRTDPKRKKTNRNYVYLIGSDKLSTELHNVSEAVNKKYMNIELDYTFNDDNDPNRFYYRSDHYNFAKNNIPVIFYFNGTHDDYHKPSDTPDKIQYDLLENRTRLVFYTAWELANREDRIVVDKKQM